jgi:HSP20 family protein
MTQLKENGTHLFPALSDFFENDSLIAPGISFRHFGKNLPASNISETSHAYKIELALPGFKKDQVRVNVEHDLLTISAENKQEKEEENKRFTRKEFSYNSLTRTFQLPELADHSKINAKYENGILNLEIEKKTKSETSGSRRIEIA